LVARVLEFRLLLCKCACFCRLVYFLFCCI